MGGAVSRSAPKGPAEPTAAELAALTEPVDKGGLVKVFQAMPVEEELRKRGPLISLEVSLDGFRMLRPGTEDSLFMFNWGQIHSWTHTTNKFTFRWFDDTKRAVIKYTLHMRHVPELLQQIQSIVESILAQRKNLALPEEAFEALLAKLRAADSRQHVDLIAAAMTQHYFWAEQGRSVLEQLTSGFDKVEAATKLHGRLIDQNRFSYMLEALDCQTDRENVWHRITALRRLQGKLGGRRGDGSGGGAGSEPGTP